MNAKIIQVLTHEIEELQYLLDRIADPNLQSYRQAVEDADMLLDCIERDEL